MTKKDIVEEVLERSLTGVTKKDVDAVINALFGLATDCLRKEGEFRVAGFGTFKLKNRKARLGRNPHTGEAVKIKASKTVGFKPADALKSSL